MLSNVSQNRNVSSTLRINNKVMDYMTFNCFRNGNILFLFVTSK